jgi:outer membrane protein assembly factor BamB
MRLITGLFALAIAVGIAVPAQALPHYVESKGVTYVANVNGAPRVSALVTSGATPLWTTVLPSVPPDLTLSLTLDKDVLYVTGYSESIATNTGFVWGVNATSGQILWFTTLLGGGVYSSATVSKDVVYVAGGAVSVPSRISALNAETGAIVWQTIFAYPSFSSPTIARDTVVVASGGFGGFPNNLIVLDAATGQSLQSIPVP